MISSNQLSQLSFTPEKDWNGEVSCLLTVNDGGQDSLKSYTLHLNVTAVADMPLVTLLKPAASSTDLDDIDITTSLGTRGFKIMGTPKTAHLGYSVSSAGDFNGDGFADVIVGAPRTDSKVYGASYIVYGGNNLTDTDVTKMTLDQGIQLLGPQLRNHQSGYTVSSAGDINGDGFADVVIGAPGNSANLDGVAYVVYGSDNATNVNLGNLGSHGFAITGQSRAFTGSSVSHAGDVNGDGFADIIIGSPYAGAPYVGAAYVIYGGAQLTHVDLTQLNNNGLKIIGAEENGAVGWAVSHAGDINGDGFTDVLVGAPFAGNDRQGVAYLIYGSNSLTTMTDLDLADLGNKGFTITGVNSSTLTSWAMSSAGDMNGDGFDDMIIGAPRAGSETNGITYVVYGGNHLTHIDLTQLGTQGFQILGPNSASSTGWSVSGAGDINHDGLADIIIAAPNAGPNYNGSAYVIYGNYYSGDINLAHLGSAGFKIGEGSAYEAFGVSVSDAGDVNGDGIADMIIGTPNGGGAYVIYGEEPSKKYYENQPIRLDELLQVSLSDSDGSETLSIEISGLPLGATLSAGTRVSADAFLCSASDLPGLSLTTPSGFSGNLNLHLYLSSHEASNGSTITAEHDLSLFIQPQSQNILTPVIFDLNLHGIDFIPLHSSSAHFDADNDGSSNPIAWVGPHDGILALDLNHDQQISLRSEIAFSDHLPGAKTDLQGLMAYDSNLDNRLDSTDSLFNDFLIWQDANQDGIGQSHELRSLSTLGISAISLDSDHNRSEPVSGVSVSGWSHYELSNGQHGLVADVGFSFNKNASIALTDLVSTTTDADSVDTTTSSHLATADFAPSALQAFDTSYLAFHSNTLNPSLEESTVVSG
jgi:hypothetical protein